MIAIKLYIVLFVEIFRMSDCKRRIQGGGWVESDKPYTVYLIMAPLSSKNYEAWMCGGALVSPNFILSSAACVVDVEYMYAVAGYIKYISDVDIEKDECTKHKKKKIVYRCYPKKYELRYEEIDYWAYIDIALLKVESPYHPEDASFQIACSYIPKPIVINYEKKFQDPGTDAIVLGWGHEQIWRKEADLDDYNQESLKYAPLLVEDKELCIQEYAVYPNMSDVINEYMICAIGKGNLDENGKLIEAEPPLADGCAMQQKLKGHMDEFCEEDQQRDKTRRDIMKSNQTNNASTVDLLDDITTPDNTTASKRTIHHSRRNENGICQNDHGGPLVTWKGGREVLIGVASVFKVTNNSDCIGPYLFTSTFCTSAFVDCVLKTDGKKRSKKEKSGRLGDMDICSAPASVRGFETIESHISWKDHPDGPAENENIGQHIARHKESDEVVHDRFAVHKKKVHVDTYVEIAKKKYLEMQRKAALKRKATKQRKAPISNNYYDPNKKYGRDPNYEENKQFAPNPIYGANEMYARATNYDANKMYTPNPTYVANINNARDPNYEANKQYAPNPMHEVNKNNARPVIYDANKQYAPNPVYQANKQYAPNPMYESNKNNARPITFDANKQYAPNPMHEVNKNNARPINYDANKQYDAPNPVYQANKKFETIERSSDGLRMRPIQPNRGHNHE